MLESGPTPESITVRYGNGVDDELQLRIENGTLMISVPKAVKNRAHSRFPGHALTPTGVMAIRCKQFHLPDL